MSNPLHLYISSLDRGPVRLEGALPGSLLDLDGDATVRNAGEISYRLTAEKKSTEVLIQGAVEVPLELECRRSGLFFSTLIQESAFLRDYPISDVPSGMIDLTAEVREAVLLLLPSYPVSPEARSESYVPPGLAGEDADEAPETEASPWSALDILHLSEP